MIFLLTCPENLDPETLLAEVRSEIALPFSIEVGSELVFRFEGEPTSDELTELGMIVASHDGSAAIAAREEREAQVRAIKEASAPLAESAREKRLRGEALTQSELAALMDYALFGA